MATAFPHLEILELVGQGGMGFVFKARQPKLERLVALKILPQSLASDSAFADRFTREGRVLARLNHPNIVTIHDFGQANGFFYLLMEFVDGVNLRQAMRAGRFTPEQALAIVPKICEALQFAHNEGILHRDIKPENILLDSKGRVKIADFGIAKLVGEPQADAALTSSGGTLGTPHYMAPEQIERPTTVDHRADIYSLGVVFYEMLTGELPLGKFQPPSQKVEVDVRLDDVVLHALEKEPARRYQQVSEVKTAVETIAVNPTDKPLSASPAPAVLGRASRVSGSAGHLARGVKVGALAFFLTAFAATLITFLMPRSYRAVTRVLVEEVTPVGGKPGASFDPYLLQTELELIQSEVVLGRVVSQLNLQERWGGRYGAQVKLSTSQAIALLKGALDLRPVRNTMLLDVACFSDRPDEAAEIANAIADSYTAQRAGQIRALEFARAKAGQDAAAMEPIPRLLRVVIIDRAVPPLSPARPNKTANIALGIVGGMVLGTLAGLVVGLFSVWKSRGVAHERVTPSALRPDRFWRRFAIAGALTVLAMILIPVGAIIIAMLLPAYNTAHRRAQAIRAEIAAKEAVGNAGRASVAETWSPDVLPKERTELFKIQTEAKSLMTAGKYEESLQRYLWYYNHAREYDQGENRLLFILADWVELGRRYPKAREALLFIRDQSAAEFEAGRGYGPLFQELTNMNAELGKSDETYALFKRLNEQNPKLAQQCYFYAESLLVSRGDYELCARYMGDPDWRFDLIRKTFDMDLASQDRAAEFRSNTMQEIAAMNLKRGLTSTWTPPDTSEMTKKASHDRFVGQVRQLIEILVGVGRKGEAEKIRDRALAIMDDPGLRTSVSDSEKKVHRSRASLEGSLPEKAESTVSSQKRS